MQNNLTVSPASGVGAKNFPVLRYGAEGYLTGRPVLEKQPSLDDVGTQRMLQPDYFTLFATQSATGLPSSLPTRNPKRQTMLFKMIEVVTRYVRLAFLITYYSLRHPFSGNVYVDYEKGRLYYEPEGKNGPA